MEKADERIVSTNVKTGISQEIHSSSFIPVNTPINMVIAIFVAIPVYFIKSLGGCCGFCFLIF